MKIPFTISSLNCYVMKGNREKMREILNNVEKKRFGVFNQVLDKIRWVKKVKDLYKPNSHMESIMVYYSDKIQPNDTVFCVLDDFEEGTMYKGMEKDKLYTLKELGL